MIIFILLAAMLPIYVSWEQDRNFVKQLMGIEIGQVRIFMTSGEDDESIGSVTIELRVEVDESINFL